MRIGGVVVVDDTHIRACGDLERFLLTEETRWKSVAKFGTTAIFQKVTSPAVDGVEWIMQPYCQNPRKPLLIRVTENAAKYIAQGTRWNPAVYNRLRSVYRKRRDM